MARILVVDDHQDFADTVRDWLETEQHAVDTVYTPGEALRHLKSSNYDLVVLDWNLPQMSGPQLCEHYRASGGNAYVIMLTGMSTVENRVQGLDSGADDYVAKPCDMTELVARVRAVLRRPTRGTGTLAGVPSSDNDEKRLKHICLSCTQEFSLTVKTCPKCKIELSRIAKKHFPGELVAGKYRIQEFLGEGGMSAVYMAENLFIGKRVALKLLHNRYLSDAQLIRRLKQEAHAAGSLEHPNLVHVYDFGITEQGEAYLVMELLTGTSLSELVAEHKRLSVAMVADIFTQICEGLAYAHDKGIIHRDLKPSNVMIIQDTGNIKIVDFGVARDLNLSDSQKITITGELIGSPPYMSPEQCSGKPPDARSDIYSLGCIMYECFAGHPPFESENTIGLIRQHVHEGPPPFAPELEVPSPWQHIVFTMLQKEPGDRFQSMEELKSQLQKNLES
jgi:DNA-binding response OmpR family regulator/tRNA A-37 threonylcarbamoyl transferase component Bud32